MKKTIFKTKSTALMAGMALLFLAIAPLGAWDDLSMFALGSSKISPNVMILMDSSGSMNCVIEHPAYNPQTTYSGTINHTYLTATGVYFYMNRTSSTTPISVTINGRSVDLFRYRHKDQPVYYTANYLRWLYYYANAAQRTEVSTFHATGFWNGSGYDLARCQRITVAKKAMIEVITQLYNDHDPDQYIDVNGNNDPYPNIGLSTFDDTGNAVGSSIKKECHTNSALNTLTGSSGIIDKIVPKGGTPLSEALAEMWVYFRGEKNEPDIEDDSQFESFEGLSTFSVDKGSFPIQDWCQLNFCIVVTDGAPSADVQIKDLNDDTVFHWKYLDPDTSTKDRWGYNPENSTNHPDLYYDWLGDPTGIKTYREDGTLDTNASGTYLLDDVADYMYTRDLFDDNYTCIKNSADYEKHLKNKQFIYTYTIGFGIDHPLLLSTAKAGGGEYFTASSYESLLTAMKNIFADIEEKTNAYAGFTAPKLTSIGSSYKGFISTFVNKINEAFWEGHIRAYQLDDNGAFTLNEDGEATNPLWDAADSLSDMDAADRNLWTWFGAAKKDFQTASFSNSDLGAVSDAQRAYIVSVVRGDATDTAIFATPDAYPYKNADGQPRRLGDTFHFQPQVIGQPLYWKTAFDASYKSFFEEYEDRREALYAGANDGVLHCFDADTGAELWGFIPAVNLQKFKALALNTDAAHQFFVDGQAFPTEIKIDPNGTDHTAWISMLTFGLGTGGPGYYGLNVTDPEDPAFLWELACYPFGAGSGKTSLARNGAADQILSNQVLLGDTEGKPAVGTLVIGNQKTPIVVLSGGYQEDRATVNPAGKSLFILNAHSGELVKMFHYGASASNSSSAQISPDLLFSIPTAPALVDYDNDGVHDAIYFGDTGGNLWKISLKDSAQTNWVLDKIFSTNQTFTGGISPQPFFITPTVGYDEAYNLWVYAGTGNRAESYNTDHTGQFYAFRDDGGDGAGGYVPADLQDISALFLSGAKDDTDADGWSDSLEYSSKTSPFNSDEHPDPDDVPKDMPQESLDADMQGVFFNFPNGNGEKLFEPTPILINRRIILNTFLPPAAAGSTPCEISGEMRYYQMRINGLKGSSGPSIDATTSLDARILGAGILDSGRYNIYLGEGEIGSDKFLLIKGEPGGGGLAINLSDVFGPIFWIDKRR